MNNQSAPASQKTDEQRKLSGFAAEAYEWLEAVAFALAVVVLLFTFAFRIVSVDGDSMLPTLQNENRVIVSCLFYSPKPNDIVIIAGLGGEDPTKYDHPLVKRVIATEGQVVDFTPDGRVMVDGTVLNEDFDLISDTGSAYQYPLTVAEDCVYVLGDNRNNSRDSRSSTVGMIKTEYILGKVQLRIFPFDSFGSVYN